jgi:hypothetical protein
LEKGRGEYLYPKRNSLFLLFKNKQKQGSFPAKSQNSIKRNKREEVVGKKA